MSSIPLFRIGNDIPIEWYIRLNGEDADLENLDLRILFIDPSGRNVALDWAVSGNQLLATFEGRQQKLIGIYTIKAIKNYGKPGMASTDKYLFQLMPHTWQAPDTADTILQIFTENMTSILTVAEIEQMRNLVYNSMARHNDDWWNMNYCLEPGFYEGCFVGRPEDSTNGEMYALLTTIAKRADQNNGTDVITQVCFSSMDAQRIFTRKIITTDRTVFEPPTTVYEDWKLVGADELDRVRQLLQEAIDLKLDAAKIGITDSGLKYNADGQVVADVYDGAAADIIDPEANPNARQLIDVFMLRSVLAYYTTTEDLSRDYMTKDGVKVLQDTNAGTSIEINGTPTQIVADEEPVGTPLGNVAPTWQAMKRATEAPTSQETLQAMQEVFGSDDSSN